MTEKLNPWAAAAGSASDFVQNWLDRRSREREADRDRDHARDEGGRDRRLSADEMILELIMEQLQNKFQNQRDEQRHQALGKIAERGIQQSRSPLDRPNSTVTALDRPRTYAAEGGQGASLEPGGEALSPDALNQLAPQNFEQWRSLKEQTTQDVQGLGLTDPLAKRPEDLLGAWKEADPGSFGRTVTPPGVQYSNQRGDYLNDQDILDFQRMQGEGKTPEEILAEQQRRQRERGMGGRNSTNFNSPRRRG